MTVTAKRPILYMGRMYQAGEPLPCHDPKMVEAWLRAGSAIQSKVEKVAGQTAPEVSAGQAGQQGGDVSKLDTEPIDRDALEQHTREELAQIAQQLGVAVPRGATKALLVELVSKALRPNEDEGAV